MAVIRIPVWEPIARPRRAGLKPGEKDDLEGTLTDAWIRFFQTQQTSIGASPSRLATVEVTGQGAAIASTAVPMGSINDGLYRVAYYARITRAATTSSSLTVTLAWTDGGISMSYSGSAVTGNTTATYQSNSQLIRADAVTPITYSTAYASVGATSMQHSLYITVERVDA